jgi:small GTP-binding protein
LILLGDAYTGKTSLILRYVRNQFSSSVQATVGSAYISKTVPLTSKQSLTLDIWDTAGQERFRSMNMGLYYRGATAAVIVYDITRRESFEGVKRWVEELRRTTGNMGKEEEGGMRGEDGKLDR